MIAFHLMYIYILDNLLLYMLLLIYNFLLYVILPLLDAQLGFNFLYIVKSVPLGVYVVKLVSFAVQSAFRYTVFLSPNFPSVSI